MTKIAIDARFYGKGHTGLGRYTTNVMKYLPNHLKDYTLQVLLRDAEYDNFPRGKNIVKVRADIPHYSLTEQIRLPSLLSSLSSNLLYTFHFNTPIRSKIPKIVTIHDLIKTHFKGSDTTTRSPWLYNLKRWGYTWDIAHTVQSASDIIVPSNTVKNDILAAFPTTSPERLHPIAEAPDEIFRKLESRFLIHESSLKLPDKYILFVGNAYPHKNLTVLLEAMKELGDYHLVIVAKPSPFLSRALAPYDRTRLTLLSELDDNDLVQVYRRATMLVTPSLMEGYGLVGLEALMVGTQVVASNIPVYREVYGDKVTYFDPSSSKDLIRAVKTIPTSHHPSTIQFSRTWDDVARDIAEVIHARMPSL